MSRKTNHKFAKVCLIIAMGIGTLYFVMNMFMYFTDKHPVIGGGMAHDSAYMDGMKIGFIFSYIISPFIYAYVTNFKGTKRYVNYIVKEGSMKISEGLLNLLMGDRTSKSNSRTFTATTNNKSNVINKTAQSSAQQMTAKKVDEFVIDAIEGGFDIKPYKDEMTTGRYRAGEVVDALEELINKYDFVLDSAIDNYKHAKKWQGYSGTASDGTIEITYTDSEVHVSYDLGRFTVSHSEANRLGSLKSFAPYIDAINY